MNGAYLLVEEGKRCLQENRLDRAEELFARAVEACPEDAGANFEMGKCRCMRDRYGEAAPFLETALRSDPGHFYAAILLAKCRKMAGEFAAARELLEQARRLDPSSEEAARELEEVSGKIAAEPTPCAPPEEAAAPAPAPARVVWYERSPIETRGFRRDVPPYRACITWFINHKCNQRCSYCQSGFEEPAGFRVRSPQEWSVIWKDLYERYGSMAVQATGGEPTLYPRFFEVLQEVSKMHNVEIQTNLSWDPDELITTVPPEYVSRVGASFHQEFSEFDAYIRKMKKLKDAGYKVETTYVAFPPFLKKAKEYLSRAEQEGVPFLILSFQGEYQGKRYPESYSEEERDALRQLNHYVGGYAPSRAEWDMEHKMVVDRVEEKEEIAKACRMGQMYAWVQPDGRAMRCCRSPVPLGNLIDGTFRLLDEAEPCRVDSCMCFRSMVLGEEQRWRRQWPGAEEKPAP